MKIVAVIPTYNRRRLLRECLMSLQKQTRRLDDIIIVDNSSTDGTREMIDSEFGFLTHYYLNKNTGSAGGFYYGIKKAYEQGFDWIWIIDNDTEAKGDALEKMVSNEIFSKEVSLLCPLKFDNNGIVLHNKHFGYFDYSLFAYKKNGLSNEDLTKKYIEINLASFTGILVNRLAIAKIGFPSIEMFTQRDDQDYCFRLLRYGKMFLIPKSIIIHKEKSNYLIVRRLGKVFKRSRLNEIWKEYYGVRNIFYLFKKGYFPKWRYLNLVWYLIKTTVAILLLDDKPFFRLRFYCQGLFDGLFDRFSKTIDPVNFIKKYGALMEHHKSNWD